MHHLDRRAGCTTYTRRPTPGRCVRVGGDLFLPHSHASSPLLHPLACVQHRRLSRRLRAVLGFTDQHRVRMPRPVNTLRLAEPTNSQISSPQFPLSTSWHLAKIRRGQHHLTVHMPAIHALDSRTHSSWVETQRRVGTLHRQFDIRIAQQRQCI